MSENRTSPWRDTEAAPALHDELERLHAKLDHLAEAVGRIDRRREELEDWAADLLPAANGAMEVASHRLQGLERSGALPLLRELVDALDTAAGRVDPEDVRAVARNAHLAAHTARAVTGPEVTAVVGRTVAALGARRQGAPPGLWSLLRRARKPHVRRGLAVMLDVLQALGEGAPAGAGGEATPVRLAPPRPGPRLPASAPAPAARTAPPASPAPAPGPGPASTCPATGGGKTLEVGGRRIETDAEGFLLDPDDWSREVAEAIAEQTGIAPLTEAHWRVIDFCRARGGDSGAAPGLRFITTELGIGPKEIYALFPGGPGIQAARVAGMGKPRSCV